MRKDCAQTQPHPLSPCYLYPKRRTVLHHWEQQLPQALYQSFHLLEACRHKAKAGISPGGLTVPSDTKLSISMSRHNRQTKRRRLSARYVLASERANRCYTLLNCGLEVVVAKGNRILPRINSTTGRSLQSYPGHIYECIYLHTYLFMYCIYLYLNIHHIFICSIYVFENIKEIKLPYSCLVLMLQTDRKLNDSKGKQP